MTYADAMARYGSDKPDLRFGCELTDLTEYFAATEFRVFQAPYVGAVVMPGGASQSRRELDGWQEWARSRGARGLAYALIGAAGEIAARWPRTCRTRRGPGWPARSVPRRATACSSRRARPRRRANCSAPHAWRSGAGAA